MNYGKRGQQLENLIEYTNNVYKSKNIALIDKVPTPWNVSYNKRTGKVYNAFPQKKGTVDFTGICKGRSIAFDAKNTQSKTSFPLANIEPHQLTYLKKHMEHGGISFIVVSFEKLNKFFYIDIYKIIAWFNLMKDGGRKSIPISYFENECIEVISKNGIPLDYLDACKL